MSPLRGNRRVLVLVDHAYEDLELWYPKLRLMEEGMEVVVAGPEKTVYAGKNGYPCKPDRSFDEVRAGDFDALVIPGGWAPDKLRRHAAVTTLVKEMNVAGKIIGIICYGGLVAISAGIVKGKSATGSLGIKDDLVNAGANWVDASAFRDENKVWGRIVADIPDFCRELVAALEEKANQ